MAVEELPQEAPKSKKKLLVIIIAAWCYCLEEAALHSF